jgi:hypothetical protein
VCTRFDEHVLVMFMEEPFCAGLLRVYPGGLFLGQMHEMVIKEYGAYTGCETGAADTEKRCFQYY